MCVRVRVCVCVLSKFLTHALGVTTHHCRSHVNTCSQRDVPRRSLGEVGETSQILNPRGHPSSINTVLYLLFLI